MEKYRNFRLSAYLFAHYLDRADEKDIQEKIDFYKRYVNLDKVYIENHRSNIDIPVEKLKKVKALFEKNGIEAAGGITSTAVVDGIRKPTVFDTFCYTDERHREKYLQIVRGIASVFDEIILDDFFFTACRCEKCIAAKGSKSWAQYRLELMEDFSHIIVAEAKKINPNVKFVIKYPNWYESYQETGYNPGKQRDIFDGIFTGTETRDPVYTAQHLQRYESYSIIRLMENTAPGRNGGGWIDPFGSFNNVNCWLEQAQLTLLAGAKELLLFNFSILADSAFIPPLELSLRRIDSILDRAGTPCGVSVWEPFDADGEDQLYNYLGMGGVPFEPTPFFDADAPEIFFTESTACDETAMEKLEKYVREGGNAVITTGFLRKCYDAGIKDMTSVRLTGRHVFGQEYMSDFANYTDERFCRGFEPVMYEQLSYKTNATWCDVALIANETNFPVLTEDNYGKGRLFVLNVPENFADLYKLPADVWFAINKHLTLGQRVFISGQAKYNFFSFGNIFCIKSYRPMTDTVRITVRGECSGLRDIESGRTVTQSTLLPKPNHRIDACSIIAEDEERSFLVPVPAGMTVFFEII